MKKDDKIWAAVNDAGEDLFLLPRMANRHGLIAGATGTGKTVTARVLAESFSDMGVPSSGGCRGSGRIGTRTDSEDMQKRIQRFGLRTRIYLPDIHRSVGYLWKKVCL